MVCAYKDTIFYYYLVLLSLLFLLNPFFFLIFVTETRYHVMTAANIKAIGIATFLHFLVDGLCVCSLYLMAETAALTDMLAFFLIYNILAFMTQPLTGWWVDRLHQRQAALLFATSLLTAAVALLLASTLWWGLTSCSMIAVAILLGMGNSMFHVWGGKLTAVLTGNDIRALGIFVSTGVLGLTVGVLYASWWLLAGMLLSITILAAIAVHSPLPLLGRAFAGDTATLKHSPKVGAATGLCFWLLLILTFVMLRSFVGEVVPSEIEKTSSILLLLALTAMAGKACGGWLARWWSISHAIVVCVGITAACLMWKGTASIPLLPILIGIFAINLTMPMTLYLANQLLPQREGLSFGLLAAVLIPGYFLAHHIDLSFDHNFMLSALLLTIAVEVGMLLLMGEKSKNVLLGAVAINILTNVPLNYFLLTYGNSTGRLVAGELMVVVVEALWYFLFVHQWRKAAVYSLLCNATSFLVGILIQYLVYYSP